MSTLTLLRGYPASGKSTYTAAALSSNPDLVALNRDDARASLFGREGVLTRNQEAIITDMQVGVARKVLQSGGDILVDGTNLVAKFAKDWADLAAVAGAEFEVIDFDASADECIIRDINRGIQGKRHVGCDVIRSFAKRYPQPWPTITARVNSQPQWEAYTHTPGLSSVIICDLDGTLATIHGRGPYDTNYETDLPHQHVIDLLVELEMRGHKIVLFSGRKEAGRKGTEYWLLNHVGWHPRGYYKLYMRADDDNRKDDLVKFDLFNEHIRGKYNVTAVFDDRLQVCRMWHVMGLPLFRVGDPDASF